MSTYESLFLGIDEMVRFLPSLEGKEVSPMPLIAELAGVRTIALNLHSSLPHSQRSLLKRRQLSRLSKISASSQISSCWDDDVSKEAACHAMMLAKVSIQGYWKLHPLYNPNISINARACAVWPRAGE